VRVTFEAVPGGTRVIVVQEGYTVESQRDDQQNGWPAFLAMLARLVEGASRGH
jgi:hypothetical protein